MSYWGWGAKAVVAGWSWYSSKKKANKADEQSAEANSMAIAESNRIMADATLKAGEMIAGGQEAAAGAIIESAKIAAKAALDAAQLSVAAQERFFAIADTKLEPFREQGLIAGDELASMLGIPNSDGVLVPYDSEKLRQTPGYEFMFQEGQTAVERSAVGTKLSGAQAKEQTMFGQGLAEKFFGNQVGYLSDLHKTGAQAAGDLAQAAVSTGAGIGQTYDQQGTNLSNIYSKQGAQLSGVYTAGAEAQASLIGSLATHQANSAIAGGANQATLYQNQQGTNNRGAETIAGIAGELFDIYQNRPKKTGTVSSGGGTTGSPA